MSKRPVCRACLVDNLTMYRVTESPYEEAYEKLSNAKLGKGNLPETFCYMCVAMLRKFQKFAALTQESNVMLEQWYKNEIDCKPKNRQQFKISTTTVEYITSKFPDPELAKDVKIKIEPDEPETINQVQFIEFTNETDPYVPEETTDVNIETADVNMDTTDVNMEDSLVKDDDSWPDADQKPEAASDDDFEPPVVKQEPKKRAVSEKTPKGTAVKRCRTKKGPVTKRKEKCKQRELTKKNARDSPDNSSRLSTNSRVQGHSGETTHDYKNLNRKKKAMKLGESYECETCNRKFANKQVLQKHAIVHSNRKPFACDQCDYKCRKGSNLKTHKMTHTGEKPFLCSVCGNSYARKSVLQTHIDKAHKDSANEDDSYENHVIETNDSAAPISKKVLDAIVKPITPVEIYSCDVCPYKCAYKYALKFHELSHTRKWPFSCDMCDYRSSSRNLAKQHLKNHYDEKEFQCSICDLKTLRKRNLEIHVRRVHFGERPLSCDKCNYKCVEKGHLKRHYMAVHSNEKPFLCHLCNYTCSTKGNLNKHLIVHNGEKKYKCSTCGYTSLRSSSLTVHVRTHTGEKPYACHVCDRRFTQKSSLNTHVRRHSQK